MLPVSFNTERGRSGPTAELKGMKKGKYPSYAMNFLSIVKVLLQQIASHATLVSKIFLPV